MQDLASKGAFPINNSTTDYTFMETKNDRESVTHTSTFQNQNF